MIQFQKAIKPVLAPMQQRLKANHLAAVTPGAAVTRPDNGFSYSPINRLNIKERKKKRSAGKETVVSILGLSTAKLTRCRSVNAPPDMNRVSGPNRALVVPPHFPK